jgi:hypothetical protein
MRWNDIGTQGTASMLAGGLVVLAVAAPLVTDALWLTLLPAAALLVLAARELHRAQSGRDGRLGEIGSTVVAAGAVGLVVAAVVRSVVLARIGFEPAWVTGSAQLAAAVLVSGLVAFGIASMRSRTVPRWAAAVLAFALPLGYATDRAIERLTLALTHGLTSDVFLEGAGFSIGMALFGVALVVLGRTVARSSLRYPKEPQRHDLIGFDERGARRLHVANPLDETIQLAGGRACRWSRSRTRTSSTREPPARADGW